MKRGSSLLVILARAALAAAIAFGGPLAASKAHAQKPAPAHAKPKTKKPKPPAKGAHAHHGSAASSAKTGSKPPPSHPPSAPAAAPAGASKPGKAESEAPAVRLSVQRVTLDNGLRVVTSVDKASPAIAVSIAYGVGSRDDVKGRSGSARLLERMMAQGSANVLAGEHARLVASHGGDVRSSTSAEVTVYSQSLPSSELALGLWLEADRMKSLAMASEPFEAERRAAQAEARAAQSSAEPSSRTRMDELIFQGSWAYEHAALGSPEDLAAVTLDELSLLRSTHYGPNNAALVIAGDVDPDEVMTLVHKYFDPIPKITVAPFTGDGLPEQTAQRTAVVRGQDARSIEVRYGWAIPDSLSADRAAVELAALVVAGGEGSRLAQALVRDKAVADSVTAVLSPLSRGPGSLRIAVNLSGAAKVGDVERLIEAELKRLGAASPSDAELARARRQARSAFVVDGLSTIQSRAERLATFELVHGAALKVNDELARFAAVSAEDVRKAASHYLGPTRRTLVETYPMSVDPAATAPPPAHTEAPSEAARPVASAEAKKPASSPHQKHDAKKPASKTKKAASKVDTKKKPSAGAKPKKPKKP